MKKTLTRKINVLFAAVIIMIIVAACGSSGSSGTTSNNPNFPPWLDEKTPDDVMWGVGAARQSSDSFSMASAENRARVSIARQLDTRVRAMFTDYNRNAGTAGAQANTSLQENVSRSLTNAQLSGSFVNGRWRAPDGTWWIRVEYKKSDARNMMAGIIENESARYAEFKASEALKMMDSQLAAMQNQTPIVVNN